MADATVPQRALHGSLILCLLVATAAMLTSCRPQYSSDRRLAGTSVSQVDDLRADVQLLNRLNSIGLSLAQTEDLIPVVNQLYSLEVQYEQRKKAVVTQMAPLLANKREMPSSSYADEAPVHAELLAAPELGLDAEVLREIFDTARNLSADEYASARERLAERVAPLYSAADEAETRAIVGTFSNGRMAAILREKAAAMAE